MTAASVEELADPVWALLEAVEDVTTYDAEVPGRPPADEDGRVHAYAVYYPGAGQPTNVALGAVGDGLEWTCQVTCVGGDRVRALWCVGEVRAALNGKRLDVAGRSLVLVETTTSTPLRRDDKLSPPRFYLPLFFSVSA